MTTQPEAILEKNFVRQLQGLGYERIRISDASQLEANLKQQLEKFNNCTFSDKEVPTER